MAKKQRDAENGDVAEAVGAAAGSSADTRSDAKNLGRRIEEAMGDAANEVRRAGGSIEEQREAMSEARRRVIDEHKALEG